MKKNIFAVLFLVIITISFNSNAASPIGEVRKVSPIKKEIVVWIKNRNQLLNMGDKLAVVVNNQVIQLRVVNPMGTVARCKLFGRDSSKIKFISKGMKVYKYKAGIEKDLLDKTDNVTVNKDERVLKISVTPPDAKLYIDDEKIDYDKDKLIKLPLKKDNNKYDIKIKKRGYDDLSHRVEVNSGELKNLNYTLNKDSEYYFFLDFITVGADYIDSEFEYYFNAMNFRLSLDNYGFGINLIRGDAVGYSFLPVEIFYPIFDIDFKKFPILFTVNYELEWFNLNFEEDDTGATDFVWNFELEHKFKLNCFFGHISQKRDLSYIGSLYVAYGITLEQQKFYVGATSGIGWTARLK